MRNLDQQDMALVERVRNYPMPEAARAGILAEIDEAYRRERATPTRDDFSGAVAGRILLLDRPRAWPGAALSPHRGCPTLHAIATGSHVVILLDNANEAPVYVPAIRDQATVRQGRTMRGARMAPRMMRNNHHRIRRLRQTAFVRSTVNLTQSVRQGMVELSGSQVRALVTRDSNDLGLHDRAAHKLLDEMSELLESIAETAKFRKEFRDASSSARRERRMVTSLMASALRAMRTAM